MQNPGNARPAHVVIAGGGFAALEASAALTALAGGRVRLTVIAPDPTFAYHPAATAEVFEDRAPLAYELSRLLIGLDASHLASRLVGVMPHAKQALLESGVKLGYDALILAIGARSHPSVSGALIFRDQRDVLPVRAVLSELESLDAPRLVIVVPSRSSWPLPAYELALRAASRLERSSERADVTIVSAERAPLEIFGGKPSRLMADLLAGRRIRFRGSTASRGVNADGSLALEFEAPVAADAVIAMPELRGVRIPGVPARWFGFIPVDNVGRVDGLSDVYAAGDVTTFPIKQGGLAAQQADHVAHTIAAELGAPVREPRYSRILQARLQDGGQSRFMRCELDEFGQPAEPSTERVAQSEEMQTKVYAQYLAPYLARHQPVDRRKAA